MCLGTFELCPGPYCERSSCHTGACAITAALRDVWRIVAVAGLGGRMRSSKRGATTLEINAASGDGAAAGAPVGWRPPSVAMGGLAAGAAVGAGEGAPTATAAAVRFEYAADDGRVGGQPYSLTSGESSGAADGGNACMLARWRAGALRRARFRLDGTSGLTMLTRGTVVETSDAAPFLSTPSCACLDGASCGWW